MNQAPVLEIAADVLAALRRHTVAALPAEAVGGLWGSRGRNRWRALEAVPLPNTAPAHDRFEADPVAFAAAEADRQRRGLEHLGFYHSHPDGPAEPSALDLAAAWPDCFLVIVTGRGEVGIRFVEADTEEAARW